ncbi:MULTISPECIES: hypothetical protein [Methylobacterium]|jgi:hypothetical protein|uniref:Uncharacterized protein n=1 Tax=Methylobacterium longum TaxID=767694 RepID=A0ABT8AJB6_9HYPH|nr:MULTISPECIES: hypothetical protein [Methylobacterium]MCJ2101323.1 hypothetical protein [Methylobacterium sp. E-046]MDN3569901.1 hypothetical protein [Methylobacterium longum]GJE14396.1 hypothetical protein FOHLNKBM_5471 [Methylobacterium longum]
MIDTSSPPPGWAEAVARAGTELGLGTAYAVMDPATWDRVRRRAGEILAGQGQALPAGWERALDRVSGRADPDGGAGDALARDEADAVLAEKGEVFAPEDDA